MADPEILASAQEQRHTMHHGLLRTILGLCGGKGATLGSAEVFYRGCSHWLCHAKCGRSDGHRKNF